MTEGTVSRKVVFVVMISVLLIRIVSNGQQLISPTHQLKQEDTALRSEVLEWTKGMFIPNKLYSAHPSSAHFPGAVKPGFKMQNVHFHFVHNQADETQAKTLTKFAFSEPYAKTLYSTGLYAIAGQAVHVILPGALRNANLYLVIGAHSDFLGGNEAKHDDWRRMPAVNSTFLLDSNFQFASSPFGGLIYLAVAPADSSIDAQVTFENVISAPYYRQGSTTLPDWKDQLRANKAPWGEIASDQMIITLPDSTLQKIKDPEKLVRLWDEILTTEFELSQLPCPLVRPVRMVMDEQISMGGMHSGYPIMIENSALSTKSSDEILINPQKSLAPSEGGANWGFFHEIGHNLQNLEWVFDGTNEVGCNFFSLYVFDQLIKTRKMAHVNIEDSVQKRLMRNFFATGASYEQYKQEPFLGLIPFMQLQKKFGWETFKKVFRWYLEYHSYDYEMAFGDDHEKANLFKINRLAERFSFITRRNLIPFF